MVRIVCQVTTAKQFLSICKAGGSTTIMCNVWQTLSHLSVSWCSAGISCVVSQVVSIASAPITGHHWIEAGSVLVAPSPQVFIDTSKMPLSLLFSRLCSSSPLSLLLETCSTPAPLWPFPGCCAAHSCLSCTGEPGTVPSTLPPHPDHSWSCWPGLGPPSLSPASN